MQKAGERMIQQLAVRLLGNYEHRLDEAVEGDYRLLERTNKYRPGLMNKAINLCVKNKSFIDEVDTQDVFDLMKEKKPELYDSIISDPEREQWARREMKSILTFLKDV